MSDEASADVFLHSFATHMACVVMADKACCIYPWALGDSDTRILRSRLTGRELDEIHLWLYKVGGSPQVCIDYSSRYAASNIILDSQKAWIVSFN